MLLDDKPRKILHPSATRWLSLEQVVNRILDYYKHLIMYFKAAVKIDKIENAQKILQNLNDTNELYLKFLKYILPIANNLNKLFQSEEPKNKEMERLVKVILSNYVKSDYLSSNHISKIHFNDPRNLMQNNDLYLGVEVELKLKSLIETKKIEKSEIHHFKNNCCQFYIESLKIFF